MVDDNFALFSYKLFRGFSKKYAKILFKDLDKDLQKAAMKITIEEYCSMMFLTEIIIVPIVTVLVGFMVFLNTQNLMDTFVASIVSFSLTVLSVFTYFYVSPTNQIQDRSKKIDNSLHFAALYMSTLSTTGMPPQLIFKTIGGFNEFGEISAVFTQISDDIEVYGYSISEALAKVAVIVPNDNLSELLWGIRSVIVSGGDLNKLLTEKSKSFTMLFKRKVEEYIQTLSIFLEMYITVVIVGTILMVVLSTVMNMMGGMVSQIQIIQTVFIYLGVPGITTALIIILKTLSPTEV